MVTGFNFELNGVKIAKEFYAARNLKPVKILIDGSPYSFQTELSEKLANYYGLHVIRFSDFLMNTTERLVKKNLKMKFHYSISIKF